MKWFLDTNTCIYFLKGKHPSIAAKLAAKKSNQISIPSIVKAELLYGAEKSTRREENLHKIYSFLMPFEVKGFDDTAASVYADVRYHLEKLGQVIGIGPNVLIIASIVLAHNGILVTHNVREFSRVPELQVEDWVE